MDLLKQYSKELDLASINKIREANAIKNKKWDKYYSLLSKIKTESSNSKITEESSQNCININCSEQENIEKLIKELIPWRKGPFKINQHLIDSEWQCWIKWKRILPYLGQIKDCNISDIGSGNGYFMYQLAKKNPKLVIGFEKSELPFQQYQFISKLAKPKNIQMELASSDSLIYYKNFFDISLCMGVLYHSRNPLKVIQDIKFSLKNNGKVFFETIIWPGKDNFCFFNPDKYSNMKNVYFIPTIKALESWIIKSGLKEFELHQIDKTTITEQRKTLLAPYSSLEEQLDPKNHDLTIEGYPAPIRAIVSAVKKL